MRSVKAATKSWWECPKGDKEDSKQVFPLPLASRFILTIIPERTGLVGTCGLLLISKLVITGVVVTDTEVTITDTSTAP